MSLQFATAFADKYLAALQEPPQMYFSNLYLKLALAKKDFTKAEAYLEKHAATFQLWVEYGMWFVRIQHGKGDAEKLMGQLESMLVQNYEMKNDEF